MATDTTGVSTETAAQAHEHDVDRTVLTQGVTQVQIPEGAGIVRIQVTPGETIQLPFQQSQMAAADGNGNLAIKVGDVTVILQGYLAAQGEADVTILDVSGEPVVVADALAAGLGLDIATAAGPAAGDQGTGPDNNGGVFSPFDPAAGIGGLNAIGGLGATQLQYGLIEREFDVIEEDEEETDTVPVLVSLTPGAPVNEDDLERQSELSLAKELEPFPNHVLNGLNNFLGGNAFPNWGHPQEQGNDPFDTNDHEYPSQYGASDNYWGVDQDREPLTSTAIASVNFFGDVPGHLSFGTGTQPIVEQLTAMGLTSHSNVLQYAVLPGAPDSDPNDGIDNSYGETLVAYYVETYGEGEYTYTNTTIVFTIAFREFEGTDPISDFNIDFTIYGIIDNVPGINDADGNILDALDIDVPFFMVDSGGSSVQVPEGTLVFKDIDDVPSFGSLTYDWVEYGEGQGAWLPVGKDPSDSDIEHDETPGVQGQEEQNAANYGWYVDQALAAAGLDGVTPLGAALTHLTVSFGADGRAGTYEEGGYVGNKEAGKTVFAGDGDTNATAFQLYMGTSAVPLAEGQTNWTTNVDGAPQVILARQVDAQTIVGYVLGESDGENPPAEIPVFVLRIDPATGEVVLVQLAQINHGDTTSDNDLVDNLLITPLGGGGTVEVLADNFDSLANWSSTGGEFVRLVGDVGTVDPQPNPASQVLLTSGGEEGESSSAQDIADFFGIDLGALDVVNDGNPANGAENATNGSAIKREIEVQAGDTLTVRFNFLENEGDGEGSGASYQDMGFIVIGGEVIRLANVGDLGTVNSGSDGDFSWSEESGYLTFTYTFTTTGPIQIGFGVMNEGDEAVDAGLLVDQLTVTRGDHGVTARATDYDGDFVETPLTVVIRDDGPTISGKIDWMVDEDGKDGGTPLAGGLPGGPGDGNGGTWIGFSNKSLGINFGTDGPAADAITFDPAKIVLRDTTGAIISPLKSHGVDVVFTWNGATSQLVGKAGDTEIMVLSVDQANGTVSFELKGPVDHPYSDDPYAPGTDLAFEDEFQIDFGFTAKDADGDTVEHTMTVRVDDDSPTLAAVTEASVTVTLDESVGADATDPQTLPTADEPAETGAIGTMTGSVTGLFQNIQFGADGPGAATAYKLVLKDVGGAGTSIGTTEVQTNLSVSDPKGLYPVDNIILVSVSDFQVNAYVGSYNGDLESTDNVLAFLVRVDEETGELTVSQFLPLSHGTDGSDALSHDDILSLVVPRGGGIYVTATVADYDGDKATVEAPAPLGISFEDDGPKATGWEFETNTRDKDFNPETKDDIYAIIDEDELPGGGQNFYSGDDDGGTKASGFVLADFGSDGAAAENGGFALNLDAGILAALKTAAGLDLHIDLANSDAGQLIVRDSNDALVFTLTLHPDAQNPSKGAWDFELHQALKHSQADTEDNIHISFGVTLTDGDGDTATSAIRIMVDDDMPAPEPDVGGSYVELTKNDLGTVEDFLLANDLPGADGLKSIEILYNGASDDNKGGKLEIIGGHVWYTAPNVQDDTNEVFWYRLTDNDGDTRDTSVTVTVTDRGGGDGSVSLKITGVGGYEDDENGMQGQTDVDPVNQLLSLPFNLKITVIDAGDTADSITIGGVPTGAVLKYGLVDLPAADINGNITITRGGAFDALLDALTGPAGADVNVVLAEHDSRDFTLTLNGVVDQVAISQGSKEAIVDAVAAQPAFSIEPLDQSKVEAGELASGTTFTVDTQVAFADFGDGNETQYIFIKTPTEPGWSLGDVSVNGSVLTPVVNPLAGSLSWPSLASGYTVYAVSSQADSGNGTVPVTIVINGPNDPTDTVTKTLEVKAVAIDVEEGSLLTDPLNNVGVATQEIDLTVTDRTGGTDQVSFVGQGQGGYEDNEATQQGQSNVDEPADQKLPLTFNLKATATDTGDAVDSVEIGGIPSGATAMWSSGGFTLTFGSGTTTVDLLSGATENVPGARAAFLADLIDGNGANLTVTLAEHDSRDVTLTMKSTIDGTATAGANASAIVDAVAAQPVFVAPAPGAQSKVETGLPASFLINTSVNFADVADANEKQYVLVKIPAAGWTLNFVTPTGNFDSTAVVALPGYPGYYVLEVQPTETGALPLTIGIYGPSDVTGTVNEEIEIRALTVDTVEGLDLDPDNNTAEAVQKVTLTVTDSTPTVNAQAAIKVDEDGLANANAGANDDGKGDDAEDDSASQTGFFSITSPVDTITAIKLDTTGGLTGLETLDGKSVRTIWDSGSATLVGFADLNNDGVKDVGERTVFTLAVTNPATGAYKLDLLEALKHSASNGGMGVNYEDDLGFTVNITVTDDDGSTGTGSVSIVIDDDTPTANPDGTFEVAEDTPLPISVFGNDKFGADGVDTANAANITFTQGAKGSVAYDPSTGLFTYSPNAGAEGADSFTYTIKDKDGDTSTATVTVNIAKDSEPQIGTPSNMTVDEDGFAFANKDADTPRSDETAGSNALIGTGSVLVSFGNDVPASLPGSIALLDTPGLDNQLQTLDGQNVTFAKIGNDLVGSVSGGTLEVIRISLTAPAAGPGAGQVTYNYQVELKQPVKHPDGGVENSDLLSGITFEVTDKDSDTKQGSFSVTVLDDVPSLTASATQTDLVVDESSLGDNATANFAGVFTSAFGADGVGADKTYALGISAPGAVSGLVDTATNQQVFLFLVGGQVIGKAGADAAAALAGSTVVFTVSVDGAGNVTLDQQRAVTHDLDGGPGLAHDDPKTLLADDLVTLTATIADRDGDSASAIANIGTNLVFEDDGPSLAASGVIPTLTVDESNFAFDHTANFAGVFVPTYGADGAGSVGGFTLGINAGATGLVDTLTGQPVVLSMNGQVVEGKTSPGGDLVFTVSVDGAGNVTLNQLRAVVHPTADADEPKSLAAADLITLTATVTDKDGDTNQATANIAQNLVFKDDGPTALSDGTLNITTLNAAVAGTNLLANDNAGADGGKMVVGIRLGGELGIYAPVDLGGTDIKIKADGSEGEPAIGTLHVNPDGSWSFTQTAGSELPPILFSYQMKDKDGDVDTASFYVNLDSVPTVTVTNTTPQTEGGEALADEDWISGGNKDVPLSPGDDAGTASAGGTWSVSGGDPAVIVGLGITSGVSPTGATTLDGSPILWFADSTVVPTTLHGKTDAAGADYFTLTVNADGTWSFTLLQPVQHGTAGTEDNVLLNPVQLIAIDLDGDSASAVIKIAIDDDMPVAAPSGNNLGVTLDESFLLANMGPAPLAGYFTPVKAGGDGLESVVYKLTGANGAAFVDGTDSNLVDTASGLPVLLYQDGNGIVGKAGTETVLVITISGDTITFDQQRAVVHADQSNPNDSVDMAGVVYITQIVTDKDGDQATATTANPIALAINDDGPTALSDGTLNITTLNAAVAGTNLLDNDNAGADGGKTVVGIRLGGEVGIYAPVDLGGTDIKIKADGSEGEPAIGTLHVNPDGSWTFTQTEGSELPPILFSYQMKDKDGDVDTASFQVNLDNVPTITVTTVTPQATGGEALVDEDFLPSGNFDVAPSTGDDAGFGTAAGNWSTTGGDPSVTVTVDGIVSGVTATGATALDGSPILWFSAGNTLPATLIGKTAVDAPAHFTLNVNANGTWAFTLHQPVKHSGVDSEDPNVLLSPVTLKATDADGDVATAAIRIAIDDDMPAAVDDGTVTVSGLNELAAGNVIVNDTAGADGGKTLVGIRLGGEVGSYTAVGAGGTDIQVKADGSEGTPAIGTLHIEPNGTWTFIQTVSSELPNLVFSYQIIDADGDTDTASFAINLDSLPTITVTNDGPQTKAGEALVDEDWLPAGNFDATASTGDDAGAASANGTWSTSNGDPSVTVTVDGIVSGVTATGANALDGSPILWFSAGNTLPATLIGKTAVDAPAHFTLIVNANGTWTFNLLQPVKHVGAGSEDPNVLLSPVTLKATDTDGDTATAQIKIAIDDDMPVAVDDGTVTVLDLNQAVAGDVLANDAAGGDGGKAVVGIRLGGELGSYTAVGAGGTDISIKADGSEGTPAIGTLHIDPNGQWSFTQTVSSELPNLTFSYQVTDADGDVDTASFGINLNSVPTITVTNLTPQTAGGEALVDEDWIAGGLKDVPASAGDDAGGASANGTWSTSNGDPTVTVTVDGIVSGVTATGAAALDGSPILWFTSGNSLPATLEGKTTAGGSVYFTLTVNADGTWTFNLQQPVKHSGAGSEDPNVLLGAVTLKATDADGDVATAQIRIAIDDDMPLADDDGLLATLDDNAANVTIGTVAGLLLNDKYGADGKAATGDIVIGGGSLGGTVTIVAGELRYTSGKNVTPGTEETETFTYTIKDADGDTETATFQVKLTDTKATFSVAPANSAVDEEGLGGNAGDSYAGGDLAGQAISVTGQALNINYGTDTPGSVTFDVAQAGLAGITTSNGTPVNFVVLNSGTLIIGYTGGVVPTGTGDAQVVFHASLDAAGTGTYDFTLKQALGHPTANTEDDKVLTFAITAKDAEGEGSTATFSVTVDDDAPVIAPSGKSTSITVDESFLGSDASAGFADSFTASFGADGEGTLTYALAVKAEGIDSGLVDTATNQAVSLHQVGATVVGKNLNGDVVFVLSVDAGGNVTLDQQRAVKHPTNGVSHDEPTSLAADDLVTLTAVITDRDNDSKQATIDIGQNLIFKDDGPSITPSVAVTLDDDALGGNANGTGDQNPNSSGTTGSLNFNFGADGAHPSAAIAFTTISTTPFLTGIERVPDGANAWLVKQDGVDIFRLQITNAATGAYQITQINPLQHPAGDNENDVTFNLGLSIMDGDGDTALTTISVNIDDDTPVAGNDGKLADLDDNASGVTIGTVAGILGNDSYGADGKAASGDLVIGVGDKGGSVAIVAGNLVYTSATNVTPGATVTETFTYTIKDKDGDTTTATFSVNLTDTKATFSVAPANASVDEEGLGGGNAGDSYAGGDLAGQAVSVTGQALNINYGTDTPGSVTFDLAQAGLAGITTSNGTPVNFTIIGGTLLIGYTGAVVPTGTSDAQVVFHAALNGAGTGTYDFTLVKALRHPTANTEDDLALTFAITAKDSEGEGSTATFTVTVDDDAPLANADTRTMDEQSSISGNVYGVTGAGAGDVADAIGADGPNAGGAVISGKSVNLAGGTISVDADGEVITGQYGSLTLKSDGTYTYQAGSVSGGNKQDVFEYTVKDADGDTKTTTLTINVNDQINFVPDAVDDVNNTSSTPLDYQLMLILDFSGSMDEIVSTPEGDKTRLEIARDSLISLLEQYKNSTSGTVSVKLIGFAEYTPFSAQYLAGSNSAFATVDAAIAALQAVTPTQGNGNTDYDDALWLAKQGIDDASWQNSVTGSLESKVYFVSDGRPTSSDTTSPFGGTGDGSNQVNDGEETIWQAALQAKGVQAIAVGVGADIAGDSAALTQLGQVAYTPGGGADTPVITVTDENQLSAALGSTAPAPINGFLFANDVVNPLDPLVSPKVFALSLVDDADTDFVSQTFDANTWTIVTNNGTLVVDRTDGSYDYTPKAGSEGKSDSFVYTIKDTNGGDQDSATLTINIKAAPVITSDGGGATASINVVEGTKAVTDVNASDADTAQAGLSYSIVGGADAALFDIDSVTGALSFKNAPDYENPADAGADNKYNVTVKVTDGGLSDTQAITVTVTDKNDVAPVLSIGGTSYTVRDNFDSVAFNGNNGTKNWLNNWTETNDDNAAATGDVRIESNSGSNALFLNDDDNDDSSIQRSVDLTGATQATLEFDYSFDTSSNDESVRVQISTDGTNWADLLVLSGNNSQGTTHFTADISAYISANTRIRFLADSGLESSDSSWFDNVQITYGAPATNYATTFTEGAGAIAIASVVSSVTDTDSVNMQSATIVLTNAKANDVMAVGALPAGITSNINTSVPGQITVTLTGPASKAAFEQAIEAVTFNNTSSTPDTTPRNITVTVNDGVANSNTATTTITVVDVNSGPVLGGMGGALAYTENEAAKIIDSDVTLTDGDSANFNGGALTVSFAANGTAADQLSVLNQGNAAGQIGVSGSNVTYGGVAIGTISGGDNGNPLVVTFTSNSATPAAIDALIQRIAFANTSDAPSTAARTVNFVVTDGDGGTSNTGVATINVTAVNDAPVLDNTKSPAFTAVNEDAAAPSGAVGTLVSALAGTSGIANVTDAEGNSIGIAVTGKAGAGTWWYSTNNGSSWQALGTPTDDTARLLNGTARLYYQPAANENGANIASITFRAWDQTSGSNGGTADTNPGNGGTTAFSSATDTASITVSAVNDNPVGVTERIITGDSSDAVILASWLMRNDTDIDTDRSKWSISAVTESDNEFGIDTNDLDANPSSFLLDSVGLGETGEGGSIDYTLLDGEGGQDSSTTVTVLGDSDNDSYIGDDGTDDNTADIVIGTGSNEALSGRGGNDILVGNGGTDTFDGGSGTDTVVFRSNVSTIGTNFEDADFENIEIIDLGDGYDAVQFGASGSSGANRLNADDVLNITDSKDVALFITGDSGDTVFIENTDGNKLSVSGTQDQGGYTHYTGTSGGNTVHLYVDSDVVVNSGTN